jgi:hypothetical protein
MRPRRWPAAAMTAPRRQRVAASVRLPRSIGRASRARLRRGPEHRHRRSVYTAAAKGATSTTPIVFLSHADPVASGHVASLGRPGGNATGLTIMMTETNVKGPELFKQAVPTLSRVSVIWDPATPSHTPGLKAVEAAGPLLGLRIQSVAVRSATEYESAFAGMARERAGGVLVLSTPLFVAGATPLAARALSASPADLPWSGRPDSSWLSVSGPPGRSASASRRRCWNGRRS